MASVLFSPITMRGLTLPNRVVVSPMCQYNSDNGSANDWHLMHLGNMSLGCAGLVMCEMTNVNPQGRISPRCAGMWSDENEKALKRVYDFCRQYGVAKLGVQLAHAGRKGPTTPPAAGGKPIMSKEEGGWTPEAPSAIPYDNGWPIPHAMTKDDIKRFAASANSRRQRLMSSLVIACGIGQPLSYGMAEGASGVQPPSSFDMIGLPPAAGGVVGPLRPA